jgi:hypothetical protein
MANPMSTGQGPAIIGVSIVFLCIAYVSVFLRFWCRQILKRSFYVHDFFILCGLALSTGLVVLLILSKLPLRVAASRIRLIITDVQHGGLGQRGAQLMLEPETYPQKLRFFGKVSSSLSPMNNVDSHSSGSGSSLTNLVRIDDMHPPLHLEPLHSHLHERQTLQIHVLGCRCNRCPLVPW